MNNKINFTIANTRSKTLKSALLIISLLALNGCQTLLHGDPNQGNNTDVKAEPYAWVTVGADSVQIAKFVGYQNQCPDIVIDGLTQPMQVRAKQGAPQQFEKVLSCETYLPAQAQSVSINGQALTLMRSQPQRIVVIGDTGCRMKMSDFQNCNHTQGGDKYWGFPKVIAAVAKVNPDLVVHLGDYHYRESACPFYKAGCQGPWGFNWATWQADFMEPARPLLAKVPWVFTRGNHEDCERAYKGWFYLLDPNPLAADIWTHCQPFTPVYRVDAGDLTLIQLDSATMPAPFSENIDPQIQATYAQMFDQVNDLATNSKQSWLFTHRSTWAISSYYDWSRFSNNLAISEPTMQAAVKTTKLAGFVDEIKLLLGGHLHNFETLKFKDDRPSFMVVGTGGTKLSPTIEPSQKQQLDALLDKLAVDPQDFYVGNDFGFALFERYPHQQWIIKYIDVHGKTIRSFVLADKNLSPVYEN